PDIIERFAEEAPFKVVHHRFDYRQGSTAAFQFAIEEASGDVIALADQDDLWLPQKLSRLETVFRDRPDIAFAFTDAHLIDDADVLQHQSMRSEEHTSELQSRENLVCRL